MKFKARNKTKKRLNAIVYYIILKFLLQQQQQRRNKNYISKALFLSFGLKYRFIEYLLR